VQFAIRLLVPLTVVAFIACGGGGDAPVPVEQRFVSAEDAPGTKDDPVEKGEEAGDLDESSRASATTRSSIPTAKT
jgi:hypothetical protein